MTRNRWKSRAWISKILVQPELKPNANIWPMDDSWVYAPLPIHEQTIRAWRADWIPDKIEKRSRMRTEGSVARSPAFEARST